MLFDSLAFERTRKAPIPCFLPLCLDHKMQILYVVSFLFIVYHLVDLTHGEALAPRIELPHLQVFRNRVKSQRVLFLSDFGAVGDGIANDTKAFKDAWAVACSSPRRSRIVVPSGRTYMVGPTDFAGPCQSKITLRVSGTIVAPKNPEVWEGLNPSKWLYFHGINHFTIDGGGVINGMGEEWWSRSCKINITNQCGHAPTVLIFHKCKDLKVSHLMTLNSQQMHMSFTSCTRVKAYRLKLIAPVDSPNTDALHISASSQVDIKNIKIETGDDCISIVNNSSRIRIRNISCRAGHGISIGSLGKSNSWSEVNDVFVNGAFLANTENGVRIKTWQGGSGFARNITFRNVLMENVSNPIIIDQYYCDSFKPCSNKTSAVKVENISFVNIQGTSVTEEAIRFACSDSFPCKAIYLQDVQLVSHSGGIMKAFCWNAMGSSLGLVRPPSCLSPNGCLILEKALPGNGHSSF